MEDDLKIKILPMEDDLKILKVEYLGNNLLDFTQILSLSLERKWPPMEDEIKILKVEYPSASNQ